MYSTYLMLYVSTALATLAWFFEGVHGLLFAAVVLLLGAVAFYYITDRAFIIAFDDIVCSLSCEDAPKLHAILRDLCRRCHLTYPDVFVADGCTPNATVGGHAGRWVIVFTIPLLVSCDQRGLRAAVAHEIAHIKAYDTLKLSLLSAAPPAILLVFELGRGSITGHWGTGYEVLLAQFDPLFFAVWVFVGALVPVALNWLGVIVAQQSEYAADRYAAELLGDPEALIRLLRRVLPARPYSPPSTVRSMVERVPVFLSSFGNAHPPMVKRIERLKQLCRPPGDGISPLPSPVVSSSEV